MNSTKKYITYAGIVLFILISSLLLTGFLKKKQEEKVFASSPVLIGIEQTYEENPHEIGLSGLEYTPPAEGDIEEYPERVRVLNMNVLGPTSLPDIAFQTLPEYLTQYFDYYMNDKTKYTAVILEDTIKDDYNLPSFHLYIEDLDLDIECIYYSSRGFYYFFSRLNPDE